MGIAPPTSETSARRQRLADLPAAVGQFGQPENGGACVAAALADDGNSGDLAAGIELDADVLHLAVNPILDADREGIAFVDDRAAALEQQMRAIERARHQRLLVLIHNEDFQLVLRQVALTGFRRGLAAVSPRQCCEPAFEQNPFRGYPGRVCCPAFERSCLREVRTEEASGRRS